MPPEEKITFSMQEKRDWDDYVAQLPRNPETGKPMGSRSQALAWLEQKRGGLTLPQDVIDPTGAATNFQKSPQEGLGTNTTPGEIGAAALELGASVALPELAIAAKGVRGLQTISKVASAFRLDPKAGFFGNLARAIGAAGTDAVIEEGVRQGVSEPLGLREDTSLEEGAWRAADNAMWGSGLTGSVTALAQGFKQAGRALPGNKFTDWLAAQEDGALAATLNAPKRNTAKEFQLVDDLIQNEDTIRRLNPAEGIDVSKPGAFKKFQTKIQTLKDGALKTKSEVYDLVDTIQSGMNRPKLTFSPADIDTIADAQNMSESTKAAFKEMYEKTLLTPSTVRASPPGIRLSQGYPTKTTLRPKYFNAKEAQKTLQSLNRELQATGYFNDSFQASIQGGDPQKLAQLFDKINGLKAMRKTVQNGLDNYADRELKAGIASGLNTNNYTKDTINEANTTISALIDYAALGDRFRAESLRGLTPGTPGDLASKNINMGEVYSMLDDAFLDGGLTNKIQGRSIRKSIARNNEAIERFQKMVKLRGTPMPGLDRLSHEAFTKGITGIVAPLSVNIENLGDLFSPESMDLLGSFVQDEAFAETMKEASTGSPEAQLQVAGQLRQQLKDQGIFQPTPVAGVHTFIPDKEGAQSGKVTDKYEREYIRQQVELNEEDPREAVRILSELNRSNTLIKIPKYLGMRVTTPDKVKVTTSSNMSSSTISRVAEDLKPKQTVKVDSTTERVDYAY